MKLGHMIFSFRDAGEPDFVVETAEAVHPKLNGTDVEALEQAIDAEVVAITKRLVPGSVTAEPA